MHATVHGLCPNDTVRQTTRMEKQSFIFRTPRWLLIVAGLLCILVGVAVPVLDDLCGPTADRELQNTSPRLFWICVAIPVLLGVSSVLFGFCRTTKTRVC